MQGYQQQPYQQPEARPGPQLHQGVVQFMNGVYAWMAAGLAITAALAYGVSQSRQALGMLYDLRNGGMTTLGYVVTFAPLILLLFFGRKIPSMSRGGATIAFILMCALLGVSLSYVPIVYQTDTIFSALGATVAGFAGMSVFGWVTKKDLSRIGLVLVMVLAGAIFASITNMFIVQSSGMSMVISLIVVAVSAGLTAYQTQAIKQQYMVEGGHGNLAINGAMALYVSFLNMFLSLLRLMGGRD